MTIGHNNPDNWKWGMFYYNKDDKRVFPPKQSHLGWTINFANPWSVLAFIGIFIGSLALTTFLMLYFQK